ncbi:BrnT family toxin [Nitrogeniibacter mangrovi]|uniref:BrnT family toxin n=1 Tax=Nitrogeniibacter mangrovi TaxID=2016596 RepID=A0A6C1AZY6_9RHOO|nr:BrnT family toxin [Nitrogeniibacter mangrovi]QID16299.1 BrnT family toxin [Nitrogeniibacter mangrovi]
MIKFEWDASKAESNLRKHGVSFDEAQSVFYDEFARQFFDDAHSVDEDRFIMLGVSNQSRILIVCHCERGEHGQLIRIISARRATTAERSYYEGPNG